jgi:uncharacterized membrane protein
VQSDSRRLLYDLIVLDFDGIHTADEVLNKLRSLQKEHLIDLEDACVVERDKDGKVHIKQAVNMTALGAARGGSMGALWGTLVGFLFLNPLAGMVVGAAAGAGTGRCQARLPTMGSDDRSSVRRFPWILRRSLCWLEA